MTRAFAPEGGTGKGRLLRIVRHLDAPALCQRMPLCRLRIPHLDNAVQVAYHTDSGSCIVRRLPLSCPLSCLPGSHYMLEKTSRKKDQRANASASPSPPMPMPMLMLMVMAPALERRRRESARQRQRLRRRRPSLPPPPSSLPLSGLRGSPRSRRRTGRSTSSSPFVARASIS